MATSTNSRHGLPSSPSTHFFSSTKQTEPSLTSSHLLQRHPSKVNSLDRILLHPTTPALPPNAKQLRKAPDFGGQTQGQREGAVT